MEMKIRGNMEDANCGVPAPQSSHSMSGNKPPAVTSAANVALILSSSSIGIDILITHHMLGGQFRYILDILVLYHNKRTCR